MKKFGKFLLLTTVVGAAAGLYVYSQKKKQEENDDFELDDYESSDDSADSSEDADRSYVNLDLDTAAEATAAKTEEFFDDEETQAAPEAE